MAQSRITSVLLVVVWLFAASASAQEPVAKPTYRAGDRWVYKRTDLARKTTSFVIEQVIERADGDIAEWKYKYLESSLPNVQKGQEGTTQFLIGAQVIKRNWLTGLHETVRFPLAVGNTWKHALSIMGAEDVNEHENDARVVGWEAVSVPAGTFKALRIDHEGRWIRQAKRISGRVTTTAWYSPEVKRFVKIRSIDYTTHFWPNVQWEDELVEYKLATE